MSLRLRSELQLRIIVLPPVRMQNELLHKHLDNNQSIWIATV
jgi:hypothetical protein